MSRSAYHPDQHRAQYDQELWLPPCVADAFAKKCQPALPADLKSMRQPLLEQIQDLTKTIKSYDDTVEETAAEKYPETAILRTVPGVGPIASLPLFLTLRRQGPLRHESGWEARISACAPNDRNPALAIRSFASRRPGIISARP